MPLYKGSRFRYVKTGRIITTDNEIETVYGTTTTTRDAPSRSRRYKVKAGETMESIAAKEYGSGDKWAVIASVNTHIFWALDLVPGDEILIPPNAFAELI